jgi:hypothetical protein
MFPSSTLKGALSICFGLTLTVAFAAQVAAPVPTIQPKKEARVSVTAKGSFEVKVVPITEGARKDAWAPGRMSIDKQFSGDLVGTSQGEMQTAMTEVQGSAGYTAIERVSGTLHGREGTFLLQHFALMSHGIPGEWIVRVVPDSGTGQLKGLEGTLTITITGKQHAYALAYSLPLLH